ncbi:MAG: hypothetical protein HKL82_08775 [Acidimicrobiaceae bacterium]|nr:hypothetical protein [Acidimicrobiaceae bacterium]
MKGVQTCGNVTGGGVATARKRGVGGERDGFTGISLAQVPREGPDRQMGLPPVVLPGVVGPGAAPY